MIKNREMNAYVTKEEWALLAYPIKIENRAKIPRWKLSNVSEVGNSVYLQITLFGNFWKELDEVFSIYVKHWTTENEDPDENGGYVVPLF